MKLDILAFGAHPDDVELACAGTLLLQMQQGYSVGVIDLTRGELGTRGSAELRDQEAAKSSKILGLSLRENLNLADGFFENNQQNKTLVIEAIRKYQPKVVFANAINDRHIDHGRGSTLISEACFLAGLPKIKTMHMGQAQEAWRPQAVYHYIQDRFIKPDFVVDISTVMEQKMEAILAFSSQFYNPDSKEAPTAISSPEFLDFIKARAAQFARDIGAKYAEGFTVERTPGITNIFDLK